MTRQTQTDLQLVMESPSARPRASSRRPVYPGMWSYERQAWRAGLRLVAGIDEAGRGPLAGPVVAAAVILPSDFDPAGITDSKTLTAVQREQCYNRIWAEAHSVGVGVVEREIIDQINILRATHLAMLTAVEDLCLKPDLCLVDGLPVPYLPAPHKAVVRGDSLSVSIAAASIIAKVTRDRLMCHLDRIYPGYGFARHKGYGTVEHLTAMSDLGLSPEHRRSFKPCAMLEDAAKACATGDGAAVDNGELEGERCLRMPTGGR